MERLIFCELGLKTPIHAPKIVFGRQNRGRGGAMLTHNELVLTFGGCYLCATFGEKSITKCNRESADRQTVRQTHALTETN